MEEFAGRVAVVTGAASGIGRAVAERLAREGMRIVLADIERPALEAAVAEMEASGFEVLGVPTDVSRWEEVEQLAQRETLTQPALDERLELLRAQGEPHEVIAALREGKERFPDELRYLSGLAITLAQDGDLEQAVPELELLLAAVGAEGERTARRPDDEGAESRYVKRLVRKLPDELQEEVTDLEASLLGG